MCAAFIKAERAGLGDKKLRPWIDNYVQVRVDRPVSPRGRHAGAQPAAAGVVVARRSLHERALPGAGRKTHRRAALLRRCGQADPAVLRAHVRARRRGCSCTAGCRACSTIRRSTGRAPMAGPSWRWSSCWRCCPRIIRRATEILELFRAHAAGLIADQGHAGLWHQLLDRRESYEETSASAMFVFAYRARHQSRLAGSAGLRARGVAGLECRGDEGE